MWPTQWLLDLSICLINTVFSAVFGTRLALSFSPTVKKVRLESHLFQYIYSLVLGRCTQTGTLLPNLSHFIPDVSSQAFLFLF